MLVEFVQFRSPHWRAKSLAEPHRCRIEAYRKLRLAGTLQEVYGQAKETAADAAEALRESAGEAGDFLRTTIEERPYTTAAIALGIGFLIGRFGRRY